MGSLYKKLFWKKLSCKERMQMKWPQLDAWERRCTELHYVRMSDVQDSIVSEFLLCLACLYYMVDLENISELSHFCSGARADDQSNDGR